MIFENAMVFSGKDGFRPGSFTVSGGRFECIEKDRKGAGQNDDAVDLDGMNVIPGLVDIHTHGAAGCDFSDGDIDCLRTIGKYQASHGITAFASTSMSLPYDRLEEAFVTASDYQNHLPHDAARLAGIHMEGPFFSEAKKGAQNAEHLRLPDIDAFHRLQDACGGLIRIVDIAPELPGAADFIREISKECKVSIGHTTADYETAMRAFDLGASHVTHLFNAMLPLHHREPGVIGAAFDRNDVVCELICDGLHVHPAMIRTAFRMLPGRVCLISDSLRCAGMPDGEYELGGQNVILKNCEARLADGTIAGAASDLYRDMVNVKANGVPVSDAVIAATLRPAVEIGADKDIGSIEPGKLADFIVCDDSWSLKHVYIDGEKIF